MRAIVIAGVLAAAISACGGSDERQEEKETMKVEDTVFAPVVTAPERVEDRTNAAVDLHRENLRERLREDEGASQEQPAEH